MRTAFLSPFINNTNRTIEIHKTLLRASGFEVVPLSVKTVLSPKVKGLFDPNNIAVFHWMETRPFAWKKGKGEPGWSLAGWGMWIFYFVLALLMRARVVYFVHDHAVHDTHGFKRWVSVRLIRLFLKATDLRAVHDPSFCSTYKAVYLPHPLYWDEQEPAPAPLPTHETLRCGAIGAVRPYKSIDRLLEVWPKGTKLLIRGRAQEDYARRLNDIITRRNMATDVSLEARFLSDQEFVETLAGLDVLILPHQVDSMLVSGAFFEGIGRVKVIIARESPFIRWVASKVEGVFAFSRDEEIPAILEHVKTHIGQYDVHKARRFAIDEFGWNHCARVYRDALTSIGDTGGTA